VAPAAKKKAVAQKGSSEEGREASCCKEKALQRRLPLRSASSEEGRQASCCEEEGPCEEGPPLKASCCEEAAKRPRGKKRAAKRPAKRAAAKK